jgi:nickel transport protein
MRRGLTFLAAAVAATAIGAVPAAQAHSIWFAQRATQLALIYGIGADDLDSVKRQPQITGVAGYDADFQPVGTTLRVAGPLLVVDSEGEAAVVTAAMDYGMWSKSPDGEWHKKGKDEVPNAQISEHNFKYAVHLKAPLTKPLPVFADQLLQIVPVEPALPQEMGKPLKVRVLFKGKPAAGAILQRDLVNDPDEAGVKTAADGTATIAIRNQGLNVLNATYVGPSDQPAKYDRMEYRSTLTFVLPHLPE